MPYQSSAMWISWPSSGLPKGPQPSGSVPIAAGRRRLHLWNWCRMSGTSAGADIQCFGAKELGVSLFPWGAKELLGVFPTT